MAHKTPFEKTIEEIKTRNDYDAASYRDLVNRITIENKIVKKLVKYALNAEYYVSVNDGGETTVTKSRHYPTIIDAVFSTDEDYLIFHRADGSRVGWVRLIYGNDGYDVISDYGAPEREYAAFCEWLKPIDEYCDKFNNPLRPYRFS